jgi:hypothetical protein
VKGRNGPGTTGFLLLHVCNGLGTTCNLPGDACSRLYTSGNLIDTSEMCTLHSKVLSAIDNPFEGLAKPARHRLPKFVECDRFVGGNSSHRHESSSFEGHGAGAVFRSTAFTTI